MRITPKTAQELADDSFDAGTYDIEVFDAEDAVSKNGNEMIVLHLQVFNKAGRHITVKDWLLDAMAHKLRHAVEAMGLLDVYSKGELKADDFKGRVARAICKPDENGYLKVRDYEKAGGTAAARPPAPRAARPPTRAPVPAGDIDDEIPF